MSDTKQKRNKIIRQQLNNRGESIEIQSTGLNPKTNAHETYIDMKLIKEHSVI